MSEGPTRTGSIDAKIGANARELFAVVAEAKAAVKELTATDPTIKVDASVAEALVKLEAVEAATEKLSAENDTLRASIGRTNDANKASGGYWQTILKVVAALIPLMGPLAGYMFAVAAAAGVMGAAGIAAIVGIREEMEAGTDVGHQYGVVLASLSNDLTQLGHTAAVSMLAELNRAAGTLHQSLPELNADVRVFSSLLGQGGNLILQTLVKGLQVANPLLVQGAVYINQLAAGMLKWTSGTGFQSFVQYAAAMLPRVADALGELALSMIRVVQATAPIGSVALQALTAVATALNGIPIEQLTQMIAAGGAFFLAYKAWSALLPVFETVQAGLVAVGLAEDFALGPIGLVVAAVTALGAAVAITAVQMNAGKDAQEDYTAAVQLDNGVIGEHVRLQAAKHLQDQGVLKTAKELGIQTDLLTSAALGQGDAQRKVNDIADVAIKKATQIRDAQAGQVLSSTLITGAENRRINTLKAVTDATEDNAKRIHLAIDAYNDLQGALGGATISTAEQLRAQQELADGYGVSVSTYATVAAAQKQTEDQTRQTTLQMQLQNDAAGLLKQSLDLLNGKTLGVAEAETSFAGSINSLSDSLKRNGKEIDGNSAAAVANQQAVQQTIQAADQLAQAKANAAGSTADATKVLADEKAQLEQNLQSQGLLTGSIQAYIDRLFAIPASVPPTKLDVDTAAATRKLQELRAFIDSFNATTQARIDAGITGGPNQVIRRAGGGSVGDGPSGTVYGPGSSTSDGVRALLSVGEEVTNASAAGYPGVRPLLKAINYDPSGTMAALARSPRGDTKNYTFPATMIVESDPRRAFAEFQRFVNLRAQ